MSKKSHLHGGESSSSSANQKLSLHQLKGRKWKLFSEQAANILDDIDDNSPSTDISSIVSTIRKSTPSVMQLNISDRNLYGLHPETDQFAAVICNHCSAIVKPQGLYNHIERRHDGQSSDSTKVYKNVHRRLSATPPKQPKCEKRRRYSMTKINEHEIIEHNTTTPATATTTVIAPVESVIMPSTVESTKSIDDNWSPSSSTVIHQQPMDIDTPTLSTSSSNDEQCKVPNEFVCHVRIESSYYPDLEQSSTSTFVDTEKLLPEIEIFTQDLEDYSNVVPEIVDANNVSVEYQTEQPNLALTDDTMIMDTNEKLTDEHVVDIETVDMTEENDDEPYVQHSTTNAVNTGVTCTTTRATKLSRPKNINARMLAEWDCYGKVPKQMTIATATVIAGDDNNDDWDSGCDSDLEDPNDVAGIFETNSFSEIFGDSRILPTSDCFIKSSISGNGDDGGEQTTTSGGGGDKENTSDSPRKWNSKTVMTAKPLQSNCFGMRKIGGGCMLSRNILSMGQLTNTSTNDCFVFNGTSGGMKRKIEKRGVRTDVALIIEKVKAHIAQKQRANATN